MTMKHKKITCYTFSKYSENTPYYSSVCMFLKVSFNRENFIIKSFIESFFGRFWILLLLECDEAPNEGVNELPLRAISKSYNTLFFRGVITSE